MDTSVGWRARVARRPGWGGLLVVAVVWYGGGFLVGVASLWGDRPARGALDWEFPPVHLQADLAPDHRTRLEEVRDIVYQVLTAYPTSARAVASLAVLHYLCYDSESEARCWDRCLQLAPDFPQAYSRLVALAEQQGDHERIVSLMRRAMTVTSPDGHAKSQRILGTALRELRRFDEARDVLADLAERERTSAEVHFVLGDVYSRLGELEKARDALEIAVALDPGRVDSLYILSMVCDRLGERERAAGYRDRFNALQSDALDSESAMGARHEMEDDRFVATRLAEVLRHAGAACFEHDDLELGEICLMMAVAVSPVDADSRRLLAEHYLRAGRRLDEARRLVEEAIELEPSARAMLVLAALAEQSGDWAAARHALEKVMALDPGNPQYQVLYDSLLQRQ